MRRSIGKPRPAYHQVVCRMTTEEGWKVVEVLYRKKYADNGAILEKDGRRVRVDWLGEVVQITPPA